MALSDQESVLVVLVLPHVLIQVVGKLLSVEFDVSAVVDVDQVLSGAETVSEVGETEVDGLVVGSAVLSEAVAETDEGVDVEGGGLVLPGGDGEEGAYDVAVDRQELVGLTAFHCRHVEQAGLRQVVPVFLTQGVVHKLVDLIRVPLSLRWEFVPGERREGVVGGQGAVVGFGLGVSKGEGKEGQEDDGLRSHGQFICSYLRAAHKESADTQFADLDFERGIWYSEGREGVQGSGFQRQREEFGTRRGKRYQGFKVSFQGRWMVCQGKWGSISFMRNALEGGWSKSPFSPAAKNVNIVGMGAIPAAVCLKEMFHHHFKDPQPRGSPLNHRSRSIFFVKPKNNYLLLPRTTTLPLHTFPTPPSITPIPPLSSILNNFIMLSQAGRQYERSKRVNPLQKAQRERVYKSFSVKVDRPAGVKKYSPFNTVSRDSRDSYLLRVTHEPNTTTNYYPKYNQILLLDRRSTIDRAKFQRRIGDVKNDQEYSLDASSIEPKCLKSHSNVEHRPLTVRESHNWRKTLEHMDFTKQQDSKRLDLPHKKLSPQETTQLDFVKSLQTITESNFNNFRRFSFQSRPEHSHHFASDSGHQYLREVQERDRLPEYDILATATNESFMHKSMPKTKGEKRFFLYKEKIATRVDRSDKNWHTFLEYDNAKREKGAGVDFNQTLNRKDNDIHSKYPIRLSLSKPVRVERGYFAA